MQVTRWLWVDGLHQLLEGGYHPRARVTELLNASLLFDWALAADGVVANKYIEHLCDGVVIFIVQGSLLLGHQVTTLRFSWIYVVVDDLIWFAIYGEVGLILDFIIQKQVAIVG